FLNFIFGIFIRSEGILYALLLKPLQLFLKITIALPANFHRHNDHRGMGHLDQFYSGLYIVAGEFGGDTRFTSSTVEISEEAIVDYEGRALFIGYGHRGLIPG